MIRYIVLDSDLACNMSNGQSTLDAAMHALHLYFRNHVYKLSKKKFVHPTVIDDEVCNIMNAAILKDDPHLKNMFSVRVERSGEDYIADLHVAVNDVHLHLVNVTAGSHLCH